MATKTVVVTRQQVFDIQLANITDELHTAITKAAHLVRDTYGEANVGSFYLAVKVSGRSMTDAKECKITYEIGQGQYSASVDGNALDSVLVESLRRHGWDRLNAPKALPPAKSES